MCSSDLRLTGTLVEAKSVWDILYFRPKVMKLDQCMPAFMQIDRTTQFGPLWILGMPFFRFFHSSFHIDEEKRDHRTIYLMGADEECKVTDLESESLDQTKGYEAPPESGNHVANMGVLVQKDNKTAATAAKAVEGKSAAGVRTIYRARRSKKQVPLEIDPKSKEISSLLRDTTRKRNAEKGEARRAERGEAGSSFKFDLSSKGSSSSAAPSSSAKAQLTA